MKLKWHRKVKGGGEYICYPPHMTSFAIERRDDKWHIFSWDEVNNNWVSLKLSYWLLKNAKIKVGMIIGSKL